MSCRVYAVVPAGTRLAGTGLRLVAAGRLAAAVEDGRALAASRRNLLAYDATVRRLADRTAAILPARFNTVVADDEEIATVLRLRRARLLAALRNVRGRVQMTVRVPSAAGPTASGRDAADTAQPTGTQYLRSRRLPQLDPLRASVKRWVRDERIEPRGSIASLYHLVPATAVDAYRAALVAAADAAGLRMVVSGPFPPYAFAEYW